MIRVKMSTQITIFKNKKTNEICYIEGKRRGVLRPEKLKKILEKKEITIRRTYDEISNKNLNWILRKTGLNKNNVEIIYHEGYLYFQNLYFTDNNENISFFQKTYFRKEKYQEKHPNECMFYNCKEKAIKSHIYSNESELQGVCDNLYKISADQSCYIETFKNVNITEIKRQKNEGRLNNCRKTLYCQQHDSEIFNKLDKCTNENINYDFAKQLTIRNISSNLFEIEEILRGREELINYFNNYKINENSIYDLFLKYIKNNIIEKEKKSISNNIVRKDKLKKLLVLFFENNENYIYKCFKIESNKSFLSYYSMNEDFSEIGIKEEGHIVFTSKIKNKYKGDFIIIAIPDNNHKIALLKKYNKPSNFMFLDLNSYDLLINESLLKEYFNYGDNKKKDNLMKEIHQIHINNYDVVGFKDFIGKIKIEKESILYSTES